jgi:hypothetical protein
VIRRVSRDFGTVKSTSQLANELCGMPSVCVSSNFAAVHVMLRLVPLLVAHDFAR